MHVTQGRSFLLWYVVCHFKFDLINFSIWFINLRNDFNLIFSFVETPLSACLLLQWRAKSG